LTREKNGAEMLNFCYVSQWKNQVGMNYAHMLCLETTKMLQIEVSA